MGDLIELMEWLVKTATPVAQETVRQVAFRGCVLTVVGVLLLCFGAYVTALFVKRVKKAIRDKKDYDLFLSIVSGIFAFVLFLLGGIAFGQGLSDWLAPLPTILGL